MWEERVVELLTAKAEAEAKCAAAEKKLAVVDGELKRLRQEAASSEIGKVCARRSVHN